MADAVYNPNTADIETTYEQLGTTKMSKGFAEIDDMNMEDIAQQNQIAPRQVRTGEMLSLIHI